MAELKARHKAFADEYIKDSNGTRAYKVAYPHIKKDETARVNASRLLTNANIKTYIDEKQAEISSSRIADAAEILQHLTSAMRGELTEETVVIEGIGDGCSEARKVRKKIGLKDRLKAAELLGKTKMLFTDKLKVEGAIPVMIVGEDDLEE